MGLLCVRDQGSHRRGHYTNSHITTVCGGAGGEPVVASRSYREHAYAASYPWEYATHGQGQGSHRGRWAGGEGGGGGFAPPQRYREEQTAMYSNGVQSGRWAETRRDETGARRVRLASSARATGRGTRARSGGATVHRQPAVRCIGDSWGCVAAVRAGSWGGLFGIGGEGEEEGGEVARAGRRVVDK